LWSVGIPSLEMRSLLLLPIVCVLVLVPGFGRAEDAVQTPESIAAAAERYVAHAVPVQGGKLFVTADRLDSRLRLRKCESALTPFLQGGAVMGARVTVGVRCTAGAPWTVYLPVSVEVEVSVLVLRQAQARGAQLTPQDVEVQTRRVKGTGSGYLWSIEQLRRRHLKLGLVAGSVLAPDVLAADYLVRRGQEVMLLATVGGIEVRAKGVALADGAAADRVRVQNLSSLKVVEGVVEDDSVVRVTL
jgi:flagellar basal body P-ring formation protein FlgA